jgi:uncharacterized protein YydD (DUF2326 family)
MEHYLAEASQSSKDKERMDYVDSRIIELDQKGQALQKKIDTVQENLDINEEQMAESKKKD